MYMVIWRFEVKPGSEQAFEKVYAASGDWAQLFQKAGEAYQGTELLREVEQPGIYVTIDRWQSHKAYEEFLKQTVNEYKELDDRCEVLTISETKIGDLEL